AAKSTYRIQCDGKDAALGVVVDKDGFILTKFSDLTGKITVKTHDGLLLHAKIVGKHEAHDLAMLKVEASGFIPIEWSESTTAHVGHFVVSAGTGQLPVALGIVSVATRNVPAAKGGGPKGPIAAGVTLGVFLVDTAQGARITDVT